MAERETPIAITLANAVAFNAENDYVERLFDWASKAEERCQTSVNPRDWEDYHDAIAELERELDRLQEPPALDHEEQWIISNDKNYRPPACPP